MKINLIWDSSVSSAPAEFKTDVQAAATILDNTFFAPITVNITVGWGEIGGTPIGDPMSAEGGCSGLGVAYSDIRAALAATYVSPVGAAALASLPAGATLDGASLFFVPSAAAKALGQLDANDPGTDGQIGFGTGWSGDSIIAGALHELTHAMGRLPGFMFDFFRFGSPGVRVYGANVPAPPAYFSLDDGAHALATFNTSPDPADFADTTPNDPFDQTASATALSLTAVDIQLMDALGFDSQAAWTGPSVAAPGGSYSAASNWSTGVVPAGNNVIIKAAGAYVVTADKNGSFLSLQIPSATAALDIAAGVGFSIGQAGSTPDLVSTNSGVIAVESAGTLHIGEQIANAGSILAHGVLDLAGGQISGAGHLKVGATGDVTLESGSFSGGTLKIKSGGVVNADGGSDVVKPAALVNNGTLEVSGAKLKLKAGTVTGTGKTEILGGALILKGASSLAVTFDGVAGKLELTNSLAYTGVVSGLAPARGSQFDLRDVAFVSAGEATFVGTSAGGTLTVSDGTHIAHIQISGNYQGDTAVAVSDGIGGVLVSFGPSAAQILFAQHGAAMTDRAPLAGETLALDRARPATHAMLVAAMR
ncbi:MAG TPA: NF038122 family metalloprotease [Caulobacteraceae bacterium]|nr:NF038122 family metalloprotease [Caulobacteraceae bacterium]